MKLGAAFAALSEIDEATAFPLTELWALNALAERDSGVQAAEFILVFHARFIAFSGARAVLLAFIDTRLAIFTFGIDEAGCRCVLTVEICAFSARLRSRIGFPELGLAHVKATENHGRAEGQQHKGNIVIATKPQNALHSFFFTTHKIKNSLADLVIRTRGAPAHAARKRRKCV